MIKSSKNKGEKKEIKEKKVESKKTIRNLLYEDIEGKFLYEDIEGKFLHIKVGDQNKPASSAEIVDIEKTVTNLFKINGVNCLVFVTHHAVDVKLIERNKKSKGKEDG